MWGSTGDFGRDAQLQLHIRAKLISLPPLAKPKDDAPPAEEVDAYYYTDNTDLHQIASEIIRIAVSDIAHKLDVELEPIHRLQLQPGSLGIFRAYEVTGKPRNLRQLMSDFTDKIRIFEEEIAKKLEVRLKGIARFRALSMISLNVVPKRDGRSDEDASTFARYEFPVALAFLCLLALLLVWFALSSTRNPSIITPPAPTQPVPARKGDLLPGRKDCGRLPSEPCCGQRDDRDGDDCYRSPCDGRDDGGREEEPGAGPCPLK